jgi:hypothetical protein
MNSLPIENGFSGCLKRFLDVLLFLGQSGANVPARTQSSAQEAGSYEPNSFGVKQVCVFLSL